MKARASHQKKKSRSEGKSTDQPVPLSPQRQRLFTTLILSFPFLIFAILEIGLRAGNYGGDLNLVLRKNVRDTQLYQINRAVAKRYFAQAGTTVPEPHDETFELVKQPNTKRIFCIGESTMEGFPYEFHATAPGFLRDRLKAMLPKYNVEVINVGLSAVGSYVVLDFMQELLDYEPDLFIVYVGHNEFYGAYGVGSTISIAGGQWLTRATLTLLKFRTFLLLRDAYSKILSLFASKETQPVGNMMQQMAASQTIPFGSPLYLEAREIYNSNLQRLISEAKSHNVPIMFSTLVSNWKDQPPFINDALNADSAFAEGKKYYGQGNFVEARIAFLRAKDYDALRFRMTEEFQELLVNLCAQHDVPLARTDSAFLTNSPHGISGNELFLEHLHPNITGYFFMAKAFADAIKKNRLLAAESDWNPAPADSVLTETSTVGEFDWALGKIKTDLLKRRWPFNKGAVNFEFSAANPIESLVFKYVKKEVAWSDARYLLAEHYAKNGQYHLARKECLAVSRVIPHHYNPLLRVADYYRLEGKREEARAAYKHCLAVEENPYGHVRLGLLFLEEEKVSEAATELQSALTINETFDDPLRAEGVSGARYLLGVAYAKMGRLQEAKNELNRALAINPNNEEAKEVLKQLP
jgi:tetratricopeptide (TPR) repeat protein